MPIATIHVTRKGTTPEAASLTKEEKTALIKGSSELLLDVLGKLLESTFAVIEEIDLENRARAGLPGTGNPAAPRSPDRMIRALERAGG